MHNMEAHNILDHSTVMSADDLIYPSVRRVSLLGISLVVNYMTPILLRLIIYFMQIPVCWLCNHINGAQTLFRF